jgi:hypothetical protein
LLATNNGALGFSRVGAGVASVSINVSLCCANAKQCSEDAVTKFHSFGPKKIGTQILASQKTTPPCTALFAD